MRGLCSLREIEEVYTFCDILNLSEIITIENVNYSLQQENFQRQR